MQQYSDSDRVFCGRITEGVLPTAQEMATDVDSIVTTKRLTQFSGSQTKLAVNLADDGTLRMSTDLPSTHILKYSGFRSDSCNLRGALEWACMDMANAGGVKTAEFALLEVPAPGGAVLHYLTERFDIPNGPDDQRLIFCEEMGGAVGMRTREAFVCTLDQMVPLFANLSTRPEEDMEQFMRQIAANLIMENGDFHGRNVAVLKVANPALTDWRSVRLAPAYDMMRTREFLNEPMQPDEREPLKMTVYDDDGNDLFAQLDFKGFAATASLMGMSKDVAQSIVEDVASGMAERAQQLLERLPAVFERHPAQKACVLETAEVVLRNARELMLTLDPPVRPRGPR